MEWSDDIKKFVLNDIDIDSLTGQLVEARKLGRFVSWFMEWSLSYDGPAEQAGLYLCDENGRVLNTGIIYEDETGAIVKKSRRSSLFTDDANRQ